MKKRFNIYSEGTLILKDDRLSNLKMSLKGKGIKKAIKHLKSNEMFIYFDPVSGRQWEYERVV
ncbi:hypothetical protein [Mangrovibacterium diazotrophicum]|uniref:Uncharacterized protein n=1 Tax=Mangrovibacterium diazotrophicum TaxID=1261403 RepID=A0A419VYL8_9BACT|nr:hypothetical protein [Mangrovibacterium diazotrophicum]RKD88337.1 hypothetical protein BC643_3485 [Mangrovibacterium diazotrophicum]